MYTDYIENLFDKLHQTKLYIGEQHIEEYESIMEQIVELFTQIKVQKGQVFFIGNGGSAAIASHMTADFMKNGGMKTYSLYDHSVTTCMGNDYGYEFVFSRPLEFLGNEGDILVAISSSGNSMNIVNAVKTAKERKMKILTLTGFNLDNKVRKLGHYNLHVPVSHYGIVESIHNLILQQVVDEIKCRDGECL